MAVDIVIPEVGESITEGTITTWYVKVGDAVEVDQPLFELETDKISTDVPSPSAGVITEIVSGDGEDVMIGATVARLDTDAAGAAPKAEAKQEQKGKPNTEATAEATPKEANTKESANAASAPEPQHPAGGGDRPLPPASRKLIEEHGLDASRIQGSGKDGQILKGDVLAYIDQQGTSEQAQMSTLAATSPVAVPDARKSSASGTPRSSAPPPAPAGGRSTRRVPMSRLRRRIAERLKEVQNTAAILTTFNEVDMKPVMDLRNTYKQAFQDRHGVKLGFMSFFVKAAIEALKEFPAVNGSIDGTDIVYNDFYDIGIAVSSDRGLVVPVVRDADRLSFAEVEKGIGDLAVAARDGNLSLDQLSGGTFTITNGGTFGSMLSTPILNAPQSAILGMHNIVKRPWVVGDSIEIRPIMYVALSYDHRIIDGAQAVRFLVKIKEILEDPARLLLEV